MITKHIFQPWVYEIENLKKEGPLQLGSIVAIADKYGHNAHVLFECYKHIEESYDKTFVKRIAGSLVSMYKSNGTSHNETVAHISKFLNLTPVQVSDYWNVRNYNNYTSDLDYVVVVGIYVGVMGNETTLKCLIDECKTKDFKPACQAIRDKFPAHATSIMNKSIEIMNYRLDIDQSDDHEIKAVAEQLNLANQHPAIAILWNQAKNNGLTPSDVPVTSRKRAWWRCPDCEYEWRQSIYYVVRYRTGCPKCGRDTDHNNDFLELEKESFDIYTKQMNTFPILSQKEMMELFQKKEAGHNVTNQIFHGNMRLVMSMVFKYAKQKNIIAKMDLIQEGNLGLLTAIDKYDFKQGVAFSTYACYWIKQKIIRYISENSRTIRLPVHIDAQLRHIHRYMKFKNNGEDNFEEIADHINNLSGLKHESPLTGKKVEQLLLLDMPHFDIDDYKDKLPDHSVDIVGKAVQEDMKERISNLLKVLSPRERDIIKMRFGMDEHKEEHTLDEIGKNFGVTRERIRQIESQILEKLRHPSLRKYIDDNHEEVQSNAVVVGEKTKSNVEVTPQQIKRESVVPAKPFKEISNPRTRYKSDVEKHKMMKEIDKNLTKFGKKYKAVDTVCRKYGMEYSIVFRDHTYYTRKKQNTK